MTILKANNIDKQSFEESTKNDNVDGIELTYTREYKVEQGYRKHFILEIEAKKNGRRQ